MEDSDISFSAKQSLIKQYRTIKSNYFGNQIKALNLVKQKKIF